MAKNQANTLKRCLISALVVVLVPITSLLIMILILYVISIIPSVQQYLQESVKLPMTNCPATFSKLDTGCYIIGKFSKSSKYIDWYDLHTYCEQFYALPVAIESERELHALARMITSAHFANASTFATSGYLAVADHTGDGLESLRFAWSATNEPLIYSKWAMGQPNIKYFDHCIGLILINNELFMKATSCLEHFIICEYQGKARFLSKTAEYYLRKIRKFISGLFKFKHI